MSHTWIDYLYMELMELILYLTIGYGYVNSRACWLQSIMLTRVLLQRNGLRYAVCCLISEPATLHMRGLLAAGRKSLAAENIQYGVVVYRGSRALSEIRNTFLNSSRPCMGLNTLVFL